MPEHRHFGVQARSPLTLTETPACRQAGAS